MFSKKKEIKHNTFLKQIGFEEKITLGTGREEAQKKVEIFLKGIFKEKYLEKDGTANLANELTKNLQGKTGKQLTKEIKRVRTILDQNNDFLEWIFGEQARETFKATIELRIADKLEAFDYQKNIEADPVNNTFYTEPLRNTPVNEPAILDYLEQGATLPVRTTSGNREPVLSQATNPPPDQQLPGGQHQPPATHPQAIPDWLEPILPVANQESVLSPGVPDFPDPSSIVVQQEAPPVIDTQPEKKDLADMTTTLLPPLQETRIMPEEEHQEIPSHEIQAVSGAETLGKSAVNEDAMFADETHKAFGVFDGAGGREAGETASTTARIITQQELAKLPDNISEEEAKREIEKILIATNEVIYKKVEENAEYKGMATTATIVKILRNGTAIIGSVGDSRAYLLRSGSQEIEQLTLDDSFSKYEVKISGKNENEAWSIQKQIANLDVASFEGYQGNLYLNLLNLNNMTQALGYEDIQPLQPNIYTVQLNPGDRLILTTDGIHDNLTDTEIAENILNHQENPQNAAVTLVDKAKERSELYNPAKKLQRPKTDDLTAIVVAIGSPEEEQDAFLPPPLP